ncbi:PTS fructose transporter subunit IA [Streptococcus massiliensis]|uniref:Membrane protein n=1 Tax=Streptococcus massiliensis TaxID=313439 RepID=A0A380L177_9STRE|nr:PTS fructose transporter subunit IA [Streptococcus massiliensis]SUN76440.1 membrane protein [Streptococcus massiliensis]
MNEQELIQGYETEIQYQKHMIENLGRWFSLFFTLASVGLVLIYFFHQNNLIVFILGIVLAVLGLLAMLVFGYGIYKGRLNLQKVIDDFESKLKLVK